MEDKEFSFVLIDDNAIDLFFHEKLIRIHGISTNITAFKEASKAIEFLNSFYSRPDLYENVIILLDLEMPEINGFDFLEYFDKMPDSIIEKTRIFIVSSSLDYANIKRCEAHYHITDVLNKPLNVDTLKAV